MKMSAGKVIYLVSHPIQYFSPQYREMIEAGINLEVWYCSDDGVKVYYDPDFDREVKWDIPLLEGYPHRFFKNSGNGLRKNKSFWSLINFGVIKAIWQLPKDSMVVIHGWAYFTHWLAMMAMNILGIKFYLKGDSNVLGENSLGTFKTILKKSILGVLFKRMAYGGLYIGELNRKFYLQYGMPEHQLHFAPMAVDERRFNPNVSSLRGEVVERMGWNNDDVIFLYTGKLSAIKNVRELIQAFAELNVANAKLVIVGDGPLTKDLEVAADELQLRKTVYFAGFVNQKMMPSIYAMADMLVIPSRYEPWGLVANEAMMVGRPVIVTDQVGCGPDLVKHGQNGYVYKLGDSGELAHYMDEFCRKRDIQRREMGKKSLDIIKGYTYQQHIQTILELTAS